MTVDEYRQAIFERVKAGLTEEEAALFNLYMSGLIASSDPRIQTDMHGPKRVYNATMEAISFGLG